MRAAGIPDAGVPGGAHGDGLTADERAGAPMSLGDALLLGADEKRLQALPAYCHGTKEERDMLSRMVLQLVRAGRGSGPGAALTRNALEQVLSGNVGVRFRDLPAGVAAQTDGREVSFDRSWARACASDPNEVTRVVAHEVTHAINHDRGMGDGAAGDLREEYRGWLVGYRAEFGHDPAHAEATDYLENTLLDPRGAYTGLASGFRDDPRAWLEGLEIEVEGHWDPGGDQLDK